MLLTFNFCFYRFLFMVAIRESVISFVHLMGKVLLLLFNTTNQQVLQYRQLSCWLFEAEQFDYLAANETKKPNFCRLLQATVGDTCLHSWEVEIRRKRAVVLLKKEELEATNTNGTICPSSSHLSFSLCLFVPSESFHLREQGGWRGAPHQGRPTQSSLQTGTKCC